MLASFPVDSQFNQTMVNNTWWLGEKYDGVRFCWNSSRNTFYARTGRIISLPPEYLQHTPNIFVDGEIWFGRKNFGATATLINNHLEYVQWHLLRMIVFDVPSHDVQHKRFEKRYAHFLSYISSINASRVLCKDNAHLSKAVKGIIDYDGEGVILRKIRTLYERGRSTSLIKLKASFGDSEAIVISKTDLIITLGLPSGQTFDVLIENILSDKEPNVGEVVTYSYEKRDQNNLPLHPFIERIRHDLSWEDVLQHAPREKKLNEYSRAVSFGLHPNEDWANRLRDYLMKYASSRNYDPLSADSWYILSYGAFREYQSSKKVLAKFKGSYFKTLKHLFPDIKFDKNNFPDVEQRKEFFIQYAKRHGFDAYNPSNWYNVSKQQIMQEGGARVIFCYNNNYSKALLELFPNIGIDNSKFATLPLWRNARNRKKFFEEYAKENRFDSRDPQAWYNQKRKDIEAKKGAGRVLMYHGDSVTRALLELFPDIGLEKSKFRHSSNIVIEESGRREFFERYATENGFDPLLADEWYNRLSHIMSVKGATSIISHHSESLSKALVDLFPEVGFDFSKFPKTPPWLLRMNAQKKKNKKRDKM